MPRLAQIGAALVVALPAFLLTDPGFRPFEARLEGKGPRVTQSFLLPSPDSLYLDYELVLESPDRARSPVIVSLNDAPVARIEVDALSRQVFGKARLPAVASQAGNNVIVLAPESDPRATLEVRARVHNYYGIAPDVPRAAIVSDEAMHLWWSGTSLTGHALRFAVLFVLMLVLEWGLSQIAGRWGAVILPAPAALLVPVCLWSLATDRHVWAFPETVAVLALAPVALIAVGAAMVRRRGLLLKLAAATAATVILLELGLRVANAISPMFVFYSDSYGRYRGRPGAPHRGSVLNSRGFNDVERSVARPPGIATRIVALGDSFAFGVVPYADNYLTLTERALSEVGPTEVINMGVSATEPKDYRAILVDEGLAYAPDLVLVSVYLGNDLESRQRRWFERSYVTTLVNFLWHLARARRTVVLETGPDAPYRDDEPSLEESSFLRIQMERAWLYVTPDEALKPAVDRAVQALADIRDLARGRGAACLVVLIPDESQVDPALQSEVAGAWGRPRDGLDFRRPTRLISTALSSAGIDTLDLLPAFESAGRETRLYKPRDTHWNRAGNQLAANQIAPVVRQMLARRAAGQGAP